MAEYRSSIVKTFAGWTAFSALRSGSPVKSREKIYPLIRTTPFGDLLEPNGTLVPAAEFNEWHRNAVTKISEAEPKLCVGWAAKIVNVYLKTAAYVGGLGRPGLMHVLHPPIDAGLWDGLERKFFNQPALLSKVHVVRQIKAICDYDTYDTIIEGCREAAAITGCLLIEVEQFWEGADVRRPKMGGNRQAR